MIRTLMYALRPQDQDELLSPNLESAPAGYYNSDLVIKRKLKEIRPVAENT